MASDEQDRAEALDDDELAGAFPPDQLQGSNQYGVTTAEERYDEPLEERISREEPDVDAQPADDEAGIQLIDEDQADGELVADEVIEDDEALDVGDVASGDTTRRDVATERNAPLPAEEAALHLTDEPEVG